MKFSIKDFFSKCDQIRSFLRIWSHLLKKSLMESFIFCTVTVTNRASNSMKCNKSQLDKKVELIKRIIFFLKIKIELDYIRTIELN